MRITVRPGGHRHLGKKSKPKPKATCSLTTNMPYGAVNKQRRQLRVGRGQN